MLTPPRSSTEQSALLCMCGGTCSCMSCHMRQKVGASSCRWMKNATAARPVRVQVSTVELLLLRQLQEEQLRDQLPRVQEAARQHRQPVAARVAAPALAHGRVRSQQRVLLHRRAAPHSHRKLAPHAT